jgi:hypothetical protein
MVTQLKFNQALYSLQLGDGPCVTCKAGTCLGNRLTFDPVTGHIKIRFTHHKVERMGVIRRPLLVDVTHRPLAKVLDLYASCARKVCKQN